MFPVHELLFSVSDTGIGISDEDKERIWKTFNMGDMSLTRERQGTGIGLALSRQLCLLLGGKIQFESEPEKGSTFTFTVKMESGNQPRKRHPEHPFSRRQPDKPKTDTENIDKSGFSCGCSRQRRNGCREIS